MHTLYSIDTIMGISSKHLLYPNQPHLLNKYQINMGFAYFRWVGVLSGINVLAPYQIDVFKLIFILPTNHDFGRWKQHLFEILF